MIGRAGFIAFLALIFLGATWCQANDSAVETSVGGLQLGKERSVSMRKESLFISPTLVNVEYEFLNTTGLPVVSEIAFPIPAYKYSFTDAGGDRDFADFKAWVDGKPIEVKKEIRAFVKGREVTADLHQAGITIEKFGNFDPHDARSEIFNLKPDVLKHLARIGALKAPEEGLEYWPEWEVHLKYHWTQAFAPGTVVHIKHEYKPVVGFSPVQLQEFKHLFKDACLDSSAFSEVKKRVTARMQIDPYNNNSFGATWVSYILTTANSWETPIRNFELLVRGEKDDLITFCWDGPMERPSQTEIRLHKTDFMPEKELKVYFLRNF